MAPEGLPDPLRVALAVARVLERLGGSRDPWTPLGSSPPVPLSANAERGDDDVSEGAVREAISRGGSFNVVHLATAVKVDVFVVGADRFDAHRVASGRRVALGTEPGAELQVDTAEYTVLGKLEWFRRGRGGETSDRQWRDVLGVLRAQGAHLDGAELSTWAERLGVSDLLARAVAEAGAAGK